MSEAKSPKPSRITRSISFKKDTLKALAIQAKKEKRSVNWLVNEAVRVALPPVRS